MGNKVVNVLNYGKYMKMIFPIDVDEDISKLMYKYLMLGK